jgi:nucleotide-binding universal stress UspA family protein
MYTIVVPLDRSLQTDKALGLGINLARAIGGHIQLVTTVPRPGRAARRQRHDHAVAEAEAYLQAARERVPAGVTAHTLVLTGETDQCLRRVARRGSDTIIAITTDRPPDVGRAMLGKHVDLVVRAATCPVVVSRADLTVPDYGRRLRTIVVPVDGSLLSELAVPHAAELARASRAGVHLVRVEEFPRSVAYAELCVQDPEGIDLITAARMRSRVVEFDLPNLVTIAGRMRDAGVTVTYEVRVGRLADEIVAAIREVDADLVVMAGHNRLGFWRVALGDVTSEVIHGAGVPVVVAPFTLRAVRQELDARGDQLTA